jgi:hypothetical protein
MFGPRRAGEQDRIRGKILTAFVTSLVATHLPVASASLVAEDVFCQLRR